MDSEKEKQPEVTINLKCLKELGWIRKEIVQELFSRLSLETINKIHKELKENEPRD